MAKDKLSDKHFMKLALKQARYGVYTTSPNPAVGCLIVRDGKILGKGYHHRAGEPHAEIMAMNDARAQGHSLEGATVYVTLEPCSHYGRTPPCAKALCEAQVKRVVMATLDPNPKVAGRGMEMLKDAGIEVKVGVCEKQALELNRAFFYSITHRRPWVFVKYGMSLDAKLSLANGQSQWITGLDARADVQRLRLWSDAIITSHSTVKADNPRLNVRDRELPKKVRKQLDLTLLRQPRRVVLDSMGTLCAGGNVRFLEPYTMFRDGDNYIIVGTDSPLPAYKDHGVAEKKAIAHTKKVSTKGKKEIPADPHAELLKNAGLSAPSAAASAADAADDSAAAAKEAALAAALAEAERVTAAEREDEIAVEQEALSAFDKDSLGLGEVSIAQATKALADVSNKRKSKARAKKASLESAVKSGKRKVSDKAGASDSVSADISESNSVASESSATKKSKRKSKSAEAAAAAAVAAGVGAATAAADAPVGVLVRPNPEAKVVLQSSNFRVEEYTEHVRLVFVPLVKDASGRSHVSLPALLDFLGALEVRVAMVEAGPTLGSAFIEQELINECYCYISPMILGKEARDAFLLPKLTELSAAMRFNSMQVKSIGHDVRLILSDLRSGAES